jgi:hypothetical protein
VRAVEAQLGEGFSAEDLKVVHAWLTRMAGASKPLPEEIPTG